MSANRLSATSSKSLRGSSLFRLLGYGFQDETVRGLTRALGGGSDSGLELVRNANGGGGHRNVPVQAPLEWHIGAAQDNVPSACRGPSIRRARGREDCARQTPRSFGFRIASFSGGVMGKLRLTFFGGIGLMNHLSYSR